MNEASVAMTAKVDPLVFASRDENEIVKFHDKQIKSLSARFAYSAADRKDIEQIGRVALLKALRRWDADRAQLWTFARPCVLGAMLTYATKRIAIAHEEVSNLSEYDDCELVEIDSIGAIEPDQETNVEIADLMKPLTNEERGVIRMFLEGRGLVDMAQVLGYSKSEVDRIYHRAVVKMRKVSLEGT